MKKQIEPISPEFSKDMKELVEFQKLISDTIIKSAGIPNKYLLPKTVVCHKCNSVHVLPEGKDYVICCGEVINSSNATYD